MILVVILYYHPNPNFDGQSSTEIDDVSTGDSRRKKLGWDQHSHWGTVELCQQAFHYYLSGIHLAQRNKGYRSATPIEPKINKFKVKPSIISF
jgi:hypothetical protein